MIIFLSACEKESSQNASDINSDNNTEEQDLAENESNAGEQDLAENESNAEDSNDLDIPSNEFKNEYTLDDFNLKGSVNYWEVRYSTTDGFTEELSYDVLRSFDQSSFNSLEDVQKDLIEGTLSVEGFTGSGFPNFNPIYGIALTDYTVTVMTTWDELIEVFDELDTEAELKTWLNLKEDWTIDHGPIFVSHRYQEIKDGYLVLFVWKGDCENKPQEIYKIYRDGRQEKVRELSLDVYDGCI